MSVTVDAREATSEGCEKGFFLKGLFPVFKWDVVSGVKPDVQTIDCYDFFKNKDDQKC